MDYAAYKILIVDDEEDLCEILQFNLEGEGFKTEVAFSAEEALKKDPGSFQLILLDVMMGEMSGFKLAKMLRKERELTVPIIFITARTEEDELLTGFSLGADDYITKPFSPKELVARIRAVLRRSGEKGEQNVVRFGELTVDLSAYTVAKGKTPLSLSATEFRLLAYLLENRGRVFTRDQLLTAVWKDEGYVEPRTVDVHIRRLRAQIEDDPAHPVYIKTRRGIGYCANADL
jgi:two-component system, OmpR family, alkaline phosphatase synthesis response regulator PhoP